MHVNGVWSREDDDDDDDGYDDDAYEKEKGDGWVRLTNTVGAKFCAQEPTCGREVCPDFTKLEEG